MSVETDKIVEKVLLHALKGHFMPELRVYLAHDFKAEPEVQAELGCGTFWRLFALICSHASLIL